MISQEVDLLFPELVSDEGEFKGLNYSGFSVLAIQEQQTIIDAQAKKIEDLESKIAKMDQLQQEMVSAINTLRQSNKSE